MGKSSKRIIYILLSLAIVVLIGVFAANSLLKNKFGKIIQEELPENLNASYKELSVNILGGTVELSKPFLTIQNKENGVKHTFITVSKLKISGISYWRYLVNNEINVGTITLENPKITYYKDRKQTIKDTVPQNISKINKSISVDLLNIKHSELIIYDSEKDSLKLFTKNLSVKIGDIELNTETLSQKIPIKYQTIKAHGDSIFLKANPYENLTVGEFSLENQHANFNNLTYKTRYSKTELSRIIQVERDHYDLTLKSLSTSGFDFGYSQEHFFTKVREVIINSPSLAIFRDKLVPDDLTIKPLYSKSIRELPFQLTIDSITINDGFLKYDEKVHEENNGGSINFGNLNATLLNIGNTHKSLMKTEISIQTIFMDQTPFSVQWDFDVQNPNDDFIFEGKIGVLEAKKMNPFTEPNLKVRLEGQLNKTFFTIDGNNNTSHTDMKINYSDFKVSLLQKNGEKRNKFLSAIVNIFISKDSKNKGDRYSESSTEATRDKTKSIFNFLWISVKNALQECLTGSTKQKE